MPPVFFHLAGDDLNEPAALPQVSKATMMQLQQAAAKHFAVVEHKGVSFEIDGIAAKSASDICTTNGVVSVLIDGKEVRPPPGPQGLPLIGNHCEVYPDHIGNHQRLFDQFGPVIKTTVMGRTVYHTNDPVISALVFSESDYFTKDINKDHPLYGVKSAHAGVFLTNTDTDTWRKAHKFFVPAFSPKAINHYTPAMQGTIEKACLLFDELETRKDAWNVYNYMLKASSQLVGQLWLGEDFKQLDHVDSPTHPIPLNILKLLGLNKKVTTWGDWYTYLPFGDPKSLRDTWHRVGSLVGDCVENRTPFGQGSLPLQEAALKSQNLADYLKRATDSRGDQLEPAGRNPALIVALTAGFVTTSSLLSWLIFSLVSYGSMQERLYLELLEKGMGPKQEMTPEFIGSLTFMDKFVKETQRKHTTSFQPARTAKTNLVLPGGYQIPKDAVVIPALHHIHNNPALWDNPSHFDPDRWDTERVKSRHRATYMPFAMGPRMCVATNFVAREVKVFLAKLIYEYEFSRQGDYPIEYDSMFQTVKPSNLYVTTVRRH